MLVRAVVLAFAVGRARSLWRGFWLAVLTFTVYRYYWDVKAHDELYKQFELGRERRDQGLVWYVLGLALTLVPLVPTVLRFVYYGIFVGNVQYLRRRFGMTDGITPAGFLGLVIPAAVVLFIGTLVGFMMVFSSFATDADGALATDEEGFLLVDSRVLFVAGWSIVVGSVLTWATLLAIAYMRLQKAINGLWMGYGYRARQLSAAGHGGPAVDRPPAAPGTAPGPRTTA